MQNEIISENYYDYFIQKLRFEQSKIKRAYGYEKMDLIIDLPEYIKTFDCLFVEEGWIIDYYYLCQSVGAEPFIFVKKINEDFVELLTHIGEKKESVKSNWLFKYFRTVKTPQAPQAPQLLPLVEKNTPEYDHKFFEYRRSVLTTDHLKVTEPLKGLFQLLIFALIGSDFAKWWHAAYSSIDIICSKKELSHHFEKYKLDTDKFSEIEKINDLPSIEENDKSIIYKLLIFSYWSGLSEKTYSINKEFPHKISLLNESLLIKYDCGICL